MISMLLNNILWAVAAFLSIIIWTKVRESSWIFIILSVLAFYSAVVYRTLVFFGIVIPGSFIYKNVDIASVISDFLPLSLLVTALVIKAVKNSKR